MKRLITKWLSILLIALFTFLPVAIAEEISTEEGDSIAEEPYMEDEISSDEEGSVEDTSGETVLSDDEDAGCEAVDKAAQEADVILDESLMYAPLPGESDAVELFTDGDAPDLDSIDGVLSEADGDPGEGDGILREGVEYDGGHGEPIADYHTLLNGFVCNMLGLSDEGMYEARNVGLELTGDMKTLYDNLKVFVGQIANGKVSTTEYTITLNSVLSADQLERVVDCLVLDCPYEFYWYSDIYTYSWKGTALTIKFGLSYDYLKGTSDSSNYSVYLAAEAAENARMIVAKFAALSDFNKLAAYRDTICDLASENTAITDEDGYWPSNNNEPWQLVWALDNDPETLSVADGYAKAFQYLCNLSSFSGNVLCYCVNGYESNEAHIWNIVRMPNGKNYLVDVYMSDLEDGSTNDWYFLRAPLSGSMSAGYYFKVTHGRTYVEGLYAYDKETLSIYSEADLTLSGVDYLDEISADNAPAIKIPKNKKVWMNLGDAYRIDTGNKQGRKFKSSKKSVATVTADGVIRAKAAGKAKITFMVGKKKRTLKLTVVDPNTPQGFRLELSNRISQELMEIDDTLVVIPVTSMGTTGGVKWKSSNKNIATVNDGWVTFKNTGNVTITATTVRGKKKAKISLSSDIIWG